MRCFRLLSILILTLIISCGHLKDAKQAYQSGHYNQTLRICQSAIAENPDDETAGLWMAKTYFAMDSVQQCRDALGHLLNLESRSSKSSSEISKVYYALGKKMDRSTEALKMFEMGEQADRNNVGILDTLAQIYEASGRYEEAIDRYDRIIILVKDASVYMTRVNALENRLAFSEGEYNKGLRALKAHEMEKAEAHFKKAADTDPNHKEAIFYYNYIKGKRLYETRYKTVMDEAVEALKLAATVKPSHAETQYLLGKSSEQAGKNYLGTAIKAYQDCLKASPNGEYADVCKKKIKALKKQKAFWEKG